MVAVLILAVVATAFFVAMALRVWTKVHGLTAWFSGTLVLPLVVAASETFYSSGWLGVGLIFSGLLSAAMAGLGVLVGWLIVRKRAGHVAT